MALSLPKAKTLTVTAEDAAGTKQKIEITTKVGKLIPTLSVPSILQLIRNTSVEPSQGMKQNTRYTAETKAGAKVLVSETDGRLGKFTLDPRTMTADDVDIMVAQHSPQMYGKKYKNIEWDSTIEGLKDVLAKKMASYLQVRRTRKGFDAIDELIAAADAVQAQIKAADAGATTFAKGAHVENKLITTADEAYKVYTSAISNFRRLGTNRAKVKMNQKYAHCEGIGLEDVFTFCTPEFEALILGKPGVFASDSGIKLYKMAGLKELLGGDFVSNISIPSDVNFITITTGLNGAYGYEDIDGGAKGNLIVDPDWSFGQRLDLKDAFTKGIVLPFQIFIQRNKA